MLYRDYRPEDRQAIGAVHDAARKTELRLAGLEEAFLPLEIAGEREGLFAYPGLFVAEDGGRVRGFAACTEEELACLAVCGSRIHAPGHRPGLGGVCSGKVPGHTHGGGAGGKHTRPGSV